MNASGYLEHSPIRSLSVDSPAVGQDFLYRHSYRLPAELVSVKFTVFTGAGVATRRPQLTVFDQSGRRLVTHRSLLTITPSFRWDIQWNTDWSISERGANITPTLSIVLLPLALCFVQQFWMIGSEFVPNGFGVNDRIANITLNMRFIE